MKTTELIIRSNDGGESVYNANKSMIEISDDYTTYRIALNDNGRISIVKVTANGLDTIIIHPETGNRILIY